MAFKPKKFEKKFNLILFHSLLNHGFCRYSTVKLRKAYSISWLHPVKIWCILAEFLLSMTNFKLTHNVLAFNKICRFGKVILE